MTFPPSSQHKQIQRCGHDAKETITIAHLALCIMQSINSANTCSCIYCKSATHSAAGNNSISSLAVVVVSIATDVVGPKYTNVLLKRMIAISSDTKYVGFCSSYTSTFGHRVLHSIFMLDKNGFTVSEACSPTLIPANSCRRTFHLAANAFTHIKCESHIYTLRCTIIYPENEHFNMEKHPADSPPNNKSSAYMCKTHKYVSNDEIRSL